MIEISAGRRRVKEKINNGFGEKNFSIYFRSAMQKIKHTKRNKKQVLNGEGV